MDIQRIPSEKLLSNGQYKMHMYYHFRGILEKPPADILHFFTILNRDKMIFDVDSCFKFSSKRVEEEGANCFLKQC